MKLQRLSLSYHAHFLIATCGGLGWFPRCAGTMGTLLGLFFFQVTKRIIPYPVSLVLLPLLIVLGSLSCEIVANVRQVKDPSYIIVDEFLGMYALCLLYRPYGELQVWGAFSLFRLYDIWKPWPIRWVEQKIPGGAGIVLDDLGAALFALISLYTLRYQFGVENF